MTKLTDISLAPACPAEVEAERVLKLLMTLNPDVLLPGQLADAVRAGEPRLARSLWLRKLSALLTETARLMELH